MQRALITGATGVLGTALIEELIEHHVEVLVLTNPESRRNDFIPLNSLVTVKPCALSELTTVQNDTGKEYDAFYHFAWSGTFGLRRNDMQLQTSNIKYALDAVDAAHRFGCKVFVGAGSQAEYGRFDGKLRSDTPCFPENGYGMAKLCAGQMTRERAHQLGMKHIWARILSVYGPNDGKDTLIMSVIRELMRGNIPKCTKGEQIWDYLYSGDAASAFRLLGEKGNDGKVYVIGSGKTRPLAKYINEIRDIAAPDGKIAFGALPYKAGQVMHLEADTTELEHDLEWHASTKFSEGILNILRYGMYQ